MMMSYPTRTIIVFDTEGSQYFFQDFIHSRVESDRHFRQSDGSDPQGNAPKCWQREGFRDEPIRNKAMLIDAF